MKVFSTIDDYILKLTLHSKYWFIILKENQYLKFYDALIGLKIEYFTDYAISTI